MIRPGVVLAGLLVLTVAEAAAKGRATLDGPWLFQPDPDAVGEARGWEKPETERDGWRRVPVPMAWDHYDPTMEDYEGVAWYALAVPAERVVRSSWQRIRFGRVNHKAKVWLNGRLVGENLTGYLPFELPATPFLRAGQTNWLVLRVENGTRYDWLPGTPIVEWVQYGGILEPVELLTTHPVHIAHRPAAEEGARRDAGALARRERVS
jgi:beta-glucuronidase